MENQLNSCPNCGAQIDNSDLVKCIYCGTTLDHQETVQMPIDSKDQIPTSQYKKQLSDPEIAQFIKEHEDFLAEIDKPAGSKFSDHPASILSVPQNEVSSSLQTKPVYFNTAKAEKAEQNAQLNLYYTAKRLKYSGLIFFAPFVWFAYDIIGAGCCYMFGWKIDNSVKPFFSLIFDHYWFTRFIIIGVIYSFFLIRDTYLFNKIKSIKDQ